MDVSTPRRVLRADRPQSARISFDSQGRAHLHVALTKDGEHTWQRSFDTEQEARDYATKTLGVKRCLTAY